MILVKPSFEILHITHRPLHLIEKSGRTCYKSEDKITISSAGTFVGKILKMGHDSVVEHASATVRFICDRGVSHEIVRHRICSFSQESTRYCNYKGGVAFVIPPWIETLSPGEYDGKEGNALMGGDHRWFEAMIDSEFDYMNLIELGWKPEQARSVLPNSLKTEIVMTANLREWRTVFELRTSTAAHPQMRELMVPLAKRFSEEIPVLFEDFA